MEVEKIPFTDLLSKIVDNRGRTCPTAETGLPLIATNCVRNDVLYPAFEKVRYVSSDTHKNWFRGHPIPGDLIFVCKGTPGRVCMTPDPVSFCIAQDMVAVRADPKKIYPKYLFALLRSPQVQAQIGNMHVGTMIPHFKKGDFEKLLLPVPDKKAQETIGDTYFELSAKIELNRRMNSTLETMARALFRSWFVDFDPVHVKMGGRKAVDFDADTAEQFPDSFQNSALGLIPKGWEVKSLSELCQLGRGASPRPINDFMNGEIPWIKIADATGAGGPFLFQTKEKVTKEGADKSVAVAPGDLILSNSATCGVPIFVELHGCIHDGWLYFKNLRSISNLYLFHVLIELAHHLVHIADGSVQKNLNTNLVGQQSVLVPPKAIIAAFDAQVSVWFAKMRNNGFESRTLANLRDTLLPKLLSGELRLPHTFTNN